MKYGDKVFMMDHAREKRQRELTEMQRKHNADGIYFWWLFGAMLVGGIVTVGLVTWWWRS